LRYMLVDPGNDISGQPFTLDEDTVDVNKNYMQKSEVGLPGTVIIVSPKENNVVNELLQTLSLTYVEACSKIMHQINIIESFTKEYMKIIGLRMD
jgi:hypothetical protein